ncbi:MAG TPA: helix-turn-helix domain-containing protein, partial [Patescibacteria group bacterium]|nr:helix-turn-helix domain-containing protein [Patescibacteria group bacterium]
MIDEIRACLMECGLTRKEADVYLALLELGPTGAQEIGKRADVNRTTTYLCLEMLKRRGLVSHFDEAKKLCFSAESPERLV